MADRLQAEAFAERIKAVILEGSYRDPAVFEAMLADEVVLHTPRFWNPVTDRRWLMGILSMIPQVIEEFTYHRQWIDGDEVLLEFRGTVDGKALHGIDIFTLDATGRVCELTVMIRPPNALAALGTKEDAMLKRLFGVASQAEFTAGTANAPI